MLYFFLFVERKLHSFFFQADVYKNDFLLEREEKNKLRDEKNSLHDELENFKRLLYEVCVNCVISELEPNWSSKTQILRFT